jgi:transketolase
MGSVSVEATAAAGMLAAQGVRATVAIVSGFNPDPTDDVATLLARFRSAITIEAQTVSGGLGSFVSSVIATHGLSCRLKILGVTSSPDGTSGSQQERWLRHGLDRASIVAQSLTVLSPAWQ